VADLKPVLFVTGHVSAGREGAFAALHERERIELALFGGRHAHGGEGTLPSLPHRAVSQREVATLAASGAYRAVIAGTGGRLALPAAWRGARRARVPFLFWAAFWAHPRNVAHAASYPLMQRIYRSANAIVTYGEHVSAYVARQGARNVHIAPQAIDNAFWSEGARDRDLQTRFRALFVGRNERAKGLSPLLDAWSRSGVADTGAQLDLVGDLKLGSNALPAGVRAHGRADAERLRNFYAGADVVVIPSIPTRTFREPWGLVANEAMNQRVAIIASDAVGAAAGGLVRDGRNGLIVPANDAGTLARALARLAVDRELCVRLGSAGARDVGAFDHDAWAAGFSRALASVGASVSVPLGNR
jgi:glycosyltransferase involved in cell wall biosynthesis